MYPFPALLILTVTSCLCKSQYTNIANVFPKEPYIEVGSDIEIVCQTSPIHGKVYWTLNSQRINGNLSKTISSSHTVLSLRNFTRRLALVQCHMTDTHHVIGGTIIRTYAKPSNISCIWEYDNVESQGVPDILTCKWKHQNQSPLPINYTVLCASDTNSTCNSQETTCTFDKISIDLWMDVTCTVRAKTEFWEAYSEPVKIHPLQLIKVNRPKFEVTTFADLPSVEWECLSKLNCHCQVKYSKLQGVNETNPETLDLETQGNKIVENVESCSNYKFAARCALEKAPWSDWSDEKIILTKLNKRDVKLRLWRTVGEPDKNGVRKVHVMWTGIPSTCQDTLTYTIKQTGVKDIECGNSTCDVDVNQDAHRIHLTVLNNDSLLVEDSVYVPAIGETGLPQVTGIQTSAFDDGILVSWRVPVQPVSGYMIDYTHNGNQYYWKESNETNTRLSGLLDEKPYNITITPLFGDKTGHGTQAPPICSRLGDPGSVTVNVQAKDKSAIVSWSVTSQEPCSGVVVNYTIFYGSKEGPKLNVTVDSTQQRFSLKDLNPNTEYSVEVEATALTGSAKSSVRHFKTKMFDPTIITALSVCGSITIFLVLCFGLCCTTQWKKFKEKPVPNPGESTMAKWPLTSHKQETWTIQPYSIPHESPCDMVYPEESQRTSTSSLPTCFNSNPDLIGEYTDPADILGPHVENENPVEPGETQHLSSPGESTSLLSPESGLRSPYRSQSSVETPAPKVVKQSKRVPGKQQDKTAPLTVYVTLGMFEQGHGR